MDKYGLIGYPLGHSFSINYLRMKELMHDMRISKLPLSGNFLKLLIPILNCAA